MLPSCGAARPVGGSTAGGHGSASQSIRWESWAPEAFARARRENRILLVSVQASWCHWCHVMNDVTFRDDEIVALVDRHFVAVRVEADTRPDIAERYYEWGWPATALLSPDARAIVELRGYQSPERFRALLESLVDDLEDGRPIARRSPPPEELDPRLADLDALRRDVVAQLDRRYDVREHAWGSPQKYPFWAPVEHAFWRARVRGETRWRERALATADRYARLIDPVWGGMYQYSTHGDWRHPHYEKIAQVQAAAIEVFVEAHRATARPRWLEHARAIERFLRAHFRTPSGGFYGSLDADISRIRDGHVEVVVHGADYYALDDDARRRVGTPRADTRVYASFNGMIIAALARLFEVTGDRETLALALAALEVVERTAGDGGGFAHDEASRRQLVHLSDQVEMGRAYLALHQATGERRFHESAIRVARFLLDARNGLLDREHGGFFAHSPDPAAVGDLALRRKPLADNAIAARLLLSLARMHGDDAFRIEAERALRAVGRRDQIRRLGRRVGEYAMALEMLNGPYVRFAVVSGADDEPTRALYRAALGVYEPVRLMERLRPGEGDYPDVGQPAVFLCTQNACSLPVTDGSRFAEAAREFMQSELAEPPR
ncbi:MAG: thioredoxin domain-containing protein [Deltaproteobacteria bacterium]|nr:thioredoxin domain-containing protein [Deltaproteobacteria bacterium]